VCRQWKLSYHLSKTKTLTKLRRALVFHEKALDRTRFQACSGHMSDVPQQARTGVASAHTWADLPLQGRTNGRFWKVSNIWPPTPPIFRRINGSLWKVASCDSTCERLHAERKEGYGRSPVFGLRTCAASRSDSGSRRGLARGPQLAGLGLGTRSESQCH
jgi:hypothetical protein